MNIELCEVVITAPNADWLAQFTRHLVEKRLCAAGQNITPIRSIFRWEGKIHDVSEARVALHTRRSLVPLIVELANEHHPYVVPCVISLPINDGSHTYLEWVLTETAGGIRDTPQ